MPARKWKFEDYDYLEVLFNKITQQLIMILIWYWTSSAIAELFFLNIAVFCILTVLFSFIFLSTKMNTFFAFALAIVSSFGSIQAFRIFKLKRKKD